MEANANDSRPSSRMLCIECTTPLPIRVSSEPEAVRIRCRFCGSVYRGVLMPDVADDLVSNVEVLQNAAELDSAVPEE